MKRYYFWLIPELLRLPDDRQRMEVFRNSHSRNWNRFGTVLALLFGAPSGIIVALHQTHGSANRFWMKVLVFVVGWCAAFMLLVAGGLMLNRSALRRRVRIELCNRAFATCLGCGYDLTGNISGVCPECGDKACPPAGLADSECFGRVA